MTLAVFNSAKKGAGVTLSSGDRVATWTAAADQFVALNIYRSTGEYWVEFELNASGNSVAFQTVGITNASGNASNFAGFDTNSKGVYETSTRGTWAYDYNNVTTNIGSGLPQMTNLSVMAMYINCNTGKFFVRVNNGTTASWIGDDPNVTPTGGFPFQVTGPIAPLYAKFHNLGGSKIRIPSEHTETAVMPAGATQGWDDASGSTAINATANVTIPGPSVSASARVRIAATLNAMIAGPTVASTGRVRISGAVAATIPGPTVVASATLSPPASGTVNVTIPGPTLQAIGQLLIGGTFNGFVPGPTLQAVGSLQPVASGTVNFTIPGPTLVANARVRIAATLNAVIAGPSIDATATVGHVASASVTIPGPSVQATATLSGDTPVSPQAIAFLMPARVDRFTIPERISVVAVPERKSTLLIPKR